MHMKFGTQIKFDVLHAYVALHSTTHKIQDGGGRHFVFFHKT